MAWKPMESSRLEKSLDGVIWSAMRRRHCNLDLSVDLPIHFFAARITILLDWAISNLVSIKSVCLAAHKQLGLPCFICDVLAVSLSLTPKEFTFLLMSSAFSDCTSVNPPTSIDHSSWDHCALSSQDDHHNLSNGPISSYTKSPHPPPAPLMKKFLRSAAKFTALSIPKKKDEKTRFRSTSSPSLVYGSSYPSAKDTEEDIDKQYDILPPVPRIVPLVPPCHQEVQVPAVISSVYHHNYPVPLVFQFPPRNSMATIVDSKRMTTTKTTMEHHPSSPYFLDRKPTPFSLDSQTSRYGSGVNLVLTKPTHTSNSSNSSGDTTDIDASLISSPTTSNNTTPTNSTSPSSASSVDDLPTTPIHPHHPRYHPIVTTHFPNLPLSIQRGGEGKVPPLPPPPPTPSIPIPIPNKNKNNKREGIRDRAVSGLKNKFFGGGGGGGNSSSSSGREKKKREKDSMKRPSTAPGGIGAGFGTGFSGNRVGAGKEEERLKIDVRVEVEKVVGPKMMNAPPAIVPLPAAAAAATTPPSQGTTEGKQKRDSSGGERRRRSCASPTHTITPDSKIGNSTPRHRTTKTTSHHPHPRPRPRSAHSTSTPTISPSTTPTPNTCARTHPHSHTPTPTPTPITIRPTPPPYQIFNNDPTQRMSLLRIKRRISFATAQGHGQGQGGEWNWDILPPPASPPPKCALPDLPVSEWYD